MGFAPAGAWTTRSNCINAIDIPTASATVNIPSPNKLMARSPIRAETKCPPMTLLGCANGALGSANSRTKRSHNCWNSRPISHSKQN